MVVAGCPPRRRLTPYKSPCTQGHSSSHQKVDRTSPDRNVDVANPTAILPGHSPPLCTWDPVPRSHRGWCRWSPSHLVVEGAGAHVPPYHTVISCPPQTRQWMAASIITLLTSPQDLRDKVSLPELEV